MKELSFAPGYYATDEGTIFSARSRKTLARNRYGFRWRSRVVTREGKVRQVYCDDPDPDKDEIHDSEEALRILDARVIEGYPSFAISSLGSVFRIIPAKRGTAARKVTLVSEVVRGKTRYVQITDAYGSRTSRSLRKLMVQTRGDDADEYEPEED